MHDLDPVTYRVVLVFPGFDEGRENAEQILEEALHHLNTEKDEPGFRFAQHVFAQLEIVPDAEEASVRLHNDDDLALMILFGLDEDEQAALTRECEKMGVPVCHTMDSSGERPAKRAARKKSRIWNVVFRKRSDDEPRAHRIFDRILTAPLDDDPDDLADRVGQLIAVMALGVMEFHWTRNQPRFNVPE